MHKFERFFAIFKIMNCITLQLLKKNFSRSLTIIYEYFCLLKYSYNSDTYAHNIQEGTPGKIFTIEQIII